MTVIYQQPIRGAVGQTTRSHPDRNAQNYMRRESVYGQQSLMRFGPRPFGQMENVGAGLSGLARHIAVGPASGMRGLGDVLDANDARAQALDAASSTVTDGNGTIYYMDAAGTPLAATDASGHTVFATTTAAAASAPDYSTILLIALGAFVVAELA